MKADYSAYYRDALRYLGCMKLEDILCKNRVGKKHVTTRVNLIQKAVVEQVIIPFLTGC